MHAPCEPLARAGEHAAKATVTLYGLTPRKLHGVNQLAEQLRSARRGARDQDERDSLADHIVQLDGNRERVNALDYAVTLFEPTAATARQTQSDARDRDRTDLEPCPIGRLAIQNRYDPGSRCRRMAWPGGTARLTA